MKFKVGDKVRIKENLIAGKLYGEGFLEQPKLQTLLSPFARLIPFYEYHWVGIKALYVPQ